MGFNHNPNEILSAVELSHKSAQYLYLYCTRHTRNESPSAMFCALKLEVCHDARDKLINFKIYNCIAFILFL